MSNRKMAKNAIILMVIVLTGIVGLWAGQQTNDPLSLWNDGSAKTAILAFVASVADNGSPSFVPPEKRVATFDMDGTIACEKPLWLEMAIAKAQLKKVAQESATARIHQPYKAAFEDDDEFLVNNFLLAMATPFAGWTVAAYQAHVADFILIQSHPDLKRKYIDLFYPPMLQLIQYLGEQAFTVYIVSGSNLLMVRASCGERFGQDSSHCIGTVPATTIYEYSAGGPVLAICGYSFGPADVNGGKVQNIFDQIGTFPVLAFGNTDGDFEMLRSTYSNSLPHLSLLLNHDDPAREYSYPADPQRAQWLATAQKEGWYVVSMAKDFKIVFSGSPTS